MFRAIRRQAVGAVMVHPLQPAPRTAILATGFQETRLIRTFPKGWTDKTDQFRPTAVAAPLRELREIADRGIRLDHAVVVFTEQHEASLTETDRDYLWRAFGVPVFEQVLAPDRTLLASECEAHEGLHVTGQWTEGELDWDPCPCGSQFPRIGVPKPEPVRAPLQVLHATA